MNSKLLLLAISIAAFASCSTVYKSGQTPDDVYYSPARSYGETNKNEQRDEARTMDNDERVIRLGVNDRRYRYFDNDYGYNPYNYGFNHGYYYNPYFWPYPVYSPIFITPGNPKNTTPRMSNLGGFGNVYNNTNNTRVAPKTGSVSPSRTYNNSNSGSAFGNAIRKIFTPDNNSSYNNTNSSSNNSNTNTNRTYTPANNTNNSSSSGSRSSGSSSSGSVSRPPRGGGN